MQLKTKPLPKKPYKATKCPNCTSELPIIESSQSQEQPKIEVEE